MNKKKLTRIIAVCMACLGMGVFAFSGCKRNDGGDTGGGGSEITGGGQDEEVAVTKVEISGNTSVKVGGKITLTAEVTPDNATHKSVTWSVIEGTECADVDSSGNLTGKAVGSVTVKATAGGVSDTYGVEVLSGGGEVVHVTGVTLDRGEAELTVGETTTLRATVQPDNADDQTYTWSTDNPEAATVSNGVVTAVGKGTANITVTTNDGNRQATCVVTVKALAPGKDPTSQGQPIVTPEAPEIKPVAGGPTITKASAGELEAAYVEWTAADSADWYNVYVSPEGADNWTQLDAPLVREYEDYYRADAVGLAAGTYDMKVVPVDGNGDEATEYAATAEKLTVFAHERAGFAFVKGTASGAYNENGTLKANAKVIYVTNDNKDSVSLTVNTGKIDETFVGLQPILTAMKKASVPLAVRLIGNVQSIKKDVDADNTVLIKENAKGITFEGIGNDATANGWTLRLVRASNVEVRNLGFMNTQAKEPDNITLESDDHVWVHNCDLFYGGAGGDSDQAKGDGALDTKLSTYITHSYNHFWDSGKCNLQGMKKESADNFITYHHNWYDHSDSRHPRIRTCTTHVYNNYFDGNAKYGVGVTTGASAFVENNYFRSTATMKPMLVAAQGTDAKGEGTFSGESGGVIKAFGNYFDGKYSLVTQNDTADKSDIDCYLAATRNERVPATYKAKEGNKNSEGAGSTYNNFDTADDMYEYSVDSPELAKEKVERYAGRVDGGDLKWTFNDQTDDVSYSLISALKTALVGYKTSVVKIGGVEVSGSAGNEGEGGGEGGETPTNPPATIEGTIVYLPGIDGTTKAGLTIAGSLKTGKASATIDNVTIDRTLEFDSSAWIEFTAPADKDYELKMYLSVASIKNNDTAAATSAFEDKGGYSIYTVIVAKGTKVKLTKKDTTQLFKLVLTPVE